jgi:hypothetical protein
VPVNKFTISNLISSRIRIGLVLATMISCLLPWSLSSGIFMEIGSDQGQNISLTWEVARVALGATYIYLVLAPMKIVSKPID